jgi:FKBP-type peptidyl-prolyl cis-trans isomerase
MKLFNKWLMIAAAGILFTACSKVSHRKTPGGMPYQVFKGKGGEAIYKGDFLKVHVTQKVNDSVYFTTDDKLPAYFPVMDAQPYDVSEVWTKIKVGDSIVAIQMMDTFLKRNPGSLPPHFKNGDKIYTHAKILGRFKNDSLMQVDKKKTEDEFLLAEIRKIEQYLASKNIKAEKTPSGVYVETLTPGTGNLIDSGNYVFVNYTGKTLAGVTFDSNVDTAFRHVQPLTFTVGRQEMVRGFDEAMTLLRRGSKARIYIPSMLAYADRPNSPLIKPYEILTFELEVTDVKDKAPAMPMPGPR